MSKHYTAATMADAIDGAGAIHDASPIHDAIAEVGSRFYGAGAGDVPGELRDAMQDTLQHGPKVSGTFLRNMDSRLGEIAGTAKRAGQNKLAAAAGHVRDAVQEAGSTPEYEAAKQLRREMGDTFGRDEAGTTAASRVLANDRFGKPMLADSKVADLATKDAASVRQVLRAGQAGIEHAKAAGVDGADVEEMQRHVDATTTAMREHFAQKLFDASRERGDSIGTDGARISAPKFAAFLKANEGVAQELLTKDQTTQLKSIAADLAETQDAERAASVRGSPTAQNLSVAKLVGGIAHGRTIASLGAKGIDASMVRGLSHVLGLPEEWSDIATASMFGGHGYGPASAALNRYRSGAAENVRSILTQALADPEFARLLVQQASPKALRSLDHATKANALHGLFARGSIAAVGGHRDDAQ